MTLRKPSGWSTRIAYSQQCKSFCEWFSVALQSYAKTMAQNFLIDLKQPMQDIEDKMYYQISALSDISGTGNNSNRKYLAVTEKKLKLLKANFHELCEVNCNGLLPGMF